MENIQWSEQLSVGIPEIDEQHKKLIAVTNKMIDAVGKKDGHATVYEVLVELVDYIAIHFDSEEHWMKNHRYPNLREHKELHYDLVKRVLMEQSNFWKGERDFPERVLDFLVKWVTEHIQKEDKKFLSVAKKQPEDTPLPKAKTKAKTAGKGVAKGKPKSKK